ncbi:hypothetical protein SHIRM173S_07908 [Streptomyces hirsutus]
MAAGVPELVAVVVLFAVSLLAVSLSAVTLLVVVLVPVALAAVRRFVVGAADGAQGGQQGLPAAVGALGADDGCFEGLGGRVLGVAVAVAVTVAGAGDDLGGAGVGERFVGVADASVPHGLEEPVRAGVVGGRAAAPDDGAPTGRGPARGAHGGDDGDAGRVLGRDQVPCDPLGLDASVRDAQLHAEAGVIDDDLRRIARHLHHAQRGSVVESRRAVPRRCAGCSGVHTRLTE